MIDIYVIQCMNCRNVMDVYPAQCPHCGAASRWSTIPGDPDVNFKKKFFPQIVLEELRKLGDAG